ncbi:glycosyltransferase family 4 protein [Exiguobacterium sp. UBA4551]|uniref:glycosyltransferase family 4 protein n=1 Tax=Exiguobacterium sp. UBA4551 TaxID=1946494 RepID=UPI00257E3683|nr:glycosyltransferase family 4 protein [Exiguobacterium sp. UBA4551]
MKVILLAPLPPPAGGIAGWTVRMKNSILNNNWEVVVVDEKVISKRSVFGKKNKIKIFNEIKRTINIWRNLFINLKDKDVKVVHSNIPTRTTSMIREYICALITKLFRKKFVIHYRCTIPNLVTTKLGMYMFEKLSNISDHIIVLNSESKKFAEAHSVTKVTVVPNFIDKKTMELKRIEIRDEVKNITYVGGVIESKGAIKIIELAKLNKNINFNLVGKCDEEIMKMNLPKNVYLSGEVNKDQVINNLLKADLFLFLSNYWGEGFSNALAEAMSLGIPCVVSDWAANKDMIENEGGIVLTINNVEKANRAISKLKNDKTIRNKYSLWNRKKVKTNYSEDIITAKYVEIYEKVLNGENNGKNNTNI